MQFRVQALACVGTGSLKATTPRGLPVRGAPGLNSEFLVSNCTSNEQARPCNYLLTNWRYGLWDEPDNRSGIRNSENKLKAILNDTAWKRIVLNLTEITVVDIICWHSEIRVIEDVEKLEAKLNLGHLSDPRILKDR
jgi:hypothetical protein